MSEQAAINSTCIIALDRINQLDLLRQSFATLFAPPVIQKEIGFSLEWLTIKPVNNIRLISALGTQLDDGEAQAIALAMELGEIPIILDDKKARRIAKQMGLNVIGTMGVLLRAKRKGLIDEVKPLLETLKDVGFYMTDDLYQETLRIADEDIYKN